jgi:hypothetical protein
MLPSRSAERSADRGHIRPFGPATIAAPVDTVGS